MPSKPIINVHHLVYTEKEGQEVTVRVRKGEHLCLTRLDWYTRKTVSKGLIKSLKVFVALNEDRAEEV